MTISSSARKAGPFAGNDVTTAFPFTFKVFTAADVSVIQADALGAETVLVLTTDYTVSVNANQDVDPGGTVTLVTPLPSLKSLVITSDIAELQPVDITNGGGFYPAVINQALDRLTILTQQLRVDVERSAKLPITRTEDADALLADVVLLADNIASVQTVGGSIGSVNAVAAIDADVVAVAANEANINAAVADLPSLAAKVSKTGDTMTGHLVAIAGATGSQVPRRSEVVGITGDETIAGIKTFSSAPLVPAAATGLQAVAAQETVRMVSGAAELPKWTTAGRPATPGDGHTGFNTDLRVNESWSAGASKWMNASKKGIFNFSSPITLAGTSTGIPSLPAEIKRVKLQVTGMSASTAVEQILRLGTAGGIVSTGYAGAGSVVSASAVSTANYTTGAGIKNAAAARLLTGEITVTRHSANIWCIKHMLSNQAASDVFVGNSFIDLGAELTQMQFVLNGAGDYDGGSVTVSLEYAE